MKSVDAGNSLQVQWIDSVRSLPRAQVQSLFGELRSHKLCDVAKGRTKKEREKKTNKGHFPGTHTY